ncbi:MAG: hypothetical protein AAF517_04760 [Planctomycetota bacterium]
MSRRLSSQNSCSVSSLLAVLFVVFVAESASAQPAFIRGDANGDGLAHMGDAILIADYLFLGCCTLPCMEAADINATADVSVSDVVYLLNWLYLGGAAPPAPTPPNCGTAPMLLGCATPPPCTGPSVTPGPAGLAYQMSVTSVTPGVPGCWTKADVAVNILNNTAGSTPLNLRAWSISIKAKPGSKTRLYSATTANSVVPTLSASFERTELGRCGRFATSAVLLDMVTPNALAPSATPYHVLDLEVFGEVGALGKLRFRDGGFCSGQPVHNTVTGGCLDIFRPAFVHTNINFVGGATDNTPVGTNVLVPLGKNVWVIFDQITVAGKTTASIVPIASANFNVPGTARIYDISTTASYTGNITVCMRYKCNWSAATAATAQLHHNGIPISATTNDFCAKTICGVVSSFSEFAISVDPALIEFRRGDANGDRRVDIGDPIAALGCQFLGTKCSDCQDAADANDDGRFDIGDAVFVLNYLFTGSDQPRDPGPFVPGTDPSDDGLEACSYEAGDGDDVEDDDDEDEDGEVIEG